MSSATVTSKGQVTIPLDVRRHLGLQPGSRLDFVRTDTGSYEIHVQAASVHDLKGAVVGPVRPISLQQMDEAVLAGAVSTLS